MVPAAVRATRRPRCRNLARRPLASASSILRRVIIALLPGETWAVGTLSTCGPSRGVLIDSIDTEPVEIHTNQPLQVRVAGHAAEAEGEGEGVEEALADPSGVLVVATVLYCRRFADCMPVFRFEAPFCSLMADTAAAGSECPRLGAGERFVLQRSWKLPLYIVRGTYDLVVEVRNAAAVPLACASLREVEVLASLFANKVRDYRDALIAFTIAASASRALGLHFPVLSRGLLPQISGFLFIGILVGPYCSNLVSHLHVFLIGGFINRVSLAFIAGAAGAEIFLPEIKALLVPMAFQLVCICGATLLVCGPGLLLLSELGVLEVPALAVQTSLPARAAVSLLAAALMTARSPATAIAVIAELRCGESKAAKMTLGITVLSDVAVLVLFSVCSQLVFSATEGHRLVADAMFLSVALELGFSALLGLATGQLLRLVLPATEDANHECRYELHDSRDGSANHAPEVEGKPDAVVALRGLLLLAILYAAFELAEDAAALTGGRLRLEPLLACTVASCLCGHDEARRANLLKALSFWTPHVLLPFFTLAGASLELPGLAAVLPAAVALVGLRMLGVALGSVLAGLLSIRFFPGNSPTGEEVRFTWLTLLAQAGVTLGLVLEVQRTFHGWSRQFGTLVLGVVVLNQLLGPVLCRVGLQRILAGARREEESAGSSDAASSSVPSSPVGSRVTVAFRPMKPGAKLITVG